MSDSARAQASGSSFYTAMRVLPPAERAAMFAIYGFCRQVDDIVDEPGPSEAERRRLLSDWRADLENLFAGGPGDLTAELAEPVDLFGLRKDDFLAIVDGMEMDVGAPIRGPTYEALDLYCDRVASAVGRLSVKVFGMDEAPGIELAHHLGRALQLTNILRDLDEDAALGRLYLPAEALAEAGIATREPLAAIAHPAIDRACRWLALRAHDHYRGAEKVLGARHKGRLRAPRLMSAVYGEILARMEAAGWTPPRERVTIGKGRLIWIALRRGLRR